MRLVKWFRNRRTVKLYETKPNGAEPSLLELYTMGQKVFGPEFGKEKLEEYRKAKLGL